MMQESARLPDLFRKVSCRLLLPVLLVWCLICSASLQANEHVQHWLLRMNAAISELNYDGHFVYLRGDMLDAMQIRHRIELGNTREYLISLTGTAREVIRDNSSITIIQNRNGKMHISQHRTTGDLTTFSSLKPDELGNSYYMRMGEDVRVAGRVAKVILLQPKDNYRYACQLVLDQGSALPLGVTLFDMAGKQVSRIMFTDLQVLYPAEELPAENALNVAENAQEYTRILEPRAVHADAVVSESPKADDPWLVSSWRFHNVPAGYQLKNYHLRDKAENMGTMEHFVFSDGLATVSVYIEAPSATGLNGEATLGAVNALGAQMNGHQLTIVGEVPVVTLKMLLSGASIGSG